VIVASDLLHYKPDAVPVTRLTTSFTDMREDTTAVHFSDTGVDSHRVDDLFRGMIKQWPSV